MVLCGPTIADKASWSRPALARARDKPSSARPALASLQVATSWQLRIKHRPTCQFRCKLADAPGLWPPDSARAALLAGRRMTDLLVQPGYYPGHMCLPRRAKVSSMVCGWPLPPVVARGRVSERLMPALTWRATGSDGRLRCI
jgi:hypothetical protein